MESLYLLVPVALIFVAVAIRFFFWAINSGQYDDLDTEGQRILFDDATDKAAKPTVAAKPEGDADQTGGSQSPSKDSPDKHSGSLH